MAKAYGLVIDLEKCIGCHTCTIACKVENRIEDGSGIRVDTIGGHRRDTPDGQFPDVSMYYLPVPCMHCAAPPCVDACPDRAIQRRDDGIVMVDEKNCSGCQACIHACPYGAFTFDRVKNVVWKCTLCAHRLEEGLEPFCVVCCETGAIAFGDLNDTSSRAHELAERHGSHALKPEAKTRPATRYLPVAPKRKGV